MRIKFRKFCAKDILPVAIFFRMILNASICEVNQRQIKEIQVRIRRFKIFFLLLSSLQSVARILFGVPDAILVCLEKSKIIFSFSGINQAQI